ncbi:tmcC, partial [Symbiodinium sp. KB8]
VANKQTKYWQELNERVPNLQRLRALALSIRFGIISADTHYQALLRINHQSVSALRSYANFLENVVHDEERASQFAIEAQRIEDQQLKENRDEAAKVKLMESTNLDVMSDNVAVVSIGGMMDNLGIITSCNPYACRLFGYSSVELLKRNISMLLPPPFDHFHDFFLN